MTEEVTKYEQIDLVKDPVRILAEAKRAADALTDVINKKPKPVIINGEQFLEFEDWQTLGRFYGYTVKLEWSRPVNFEGVRGWESRAVVLDRDGREVSAAEAMCLNDEEKWSSKAKYDYLYILKDGTKQAENPSKEQIVWVDNPKKAGKKMPKKERVKLGDLPVPFFQLRSMSQTRASAKAFRNVLAWIVVLAGYKPTPAEEMIPTEEGIQEAEFAEEEKRKAPESSNKEEGKPEAPPPPSGQGTELASQPQAKLIYAMLKKKGIPDDEFKFVFKESPFKLEKRLVNEALQWIEKYNPAT